MLGILYAAPAVGWAAMIYVWSGTSGVDIEEIKPTFGPWSLPAFWFHFAEFGLLAGLILGASLAWRASMGLGTHMKMRLGLGIMTLAVAVVYGASDEYHQSFIPGRAPQVIDVLADFAGALAAACSVLAVAAWRSWKKP